MHLTEGRKEGNARRFASAVMLAVGAGLTGIDEASAQSNLGGAWTQAFNHQTGIPPLPPNNSATDPTTAFSSPTYTVTWVTPDGAFPPEMNAVHAALIPKGPYQGRVLVWDELPRIGTPPAGMTSPTGLYSYQAYSIVDTSAVIQQGDFRFLNFLLPIRPVELDANGNPVGTGLFCAGHTWTQHGDLVVVGGTRFTDVGPPPTPLRQAAADMTWVFAPSEQSVDYPGRYGRWFEGPTLTSSRYYPTAMLTGLIPRLNRHAVLVLGGETTVDDQPDGTWNNFEALIVASPADATSPTNPSGLLKDTFTNMLNQTTQWSGPGVSSNPFDDSLSFYPRCHLLTNGQVFMSGFAQRSSRLDHQTTLWSQGPGQSPVSGGWNQFRKYGSSVRFPNLGPYQDWVIRVGGDSATGITTSTVEAINAGDPTSPWFPTFSMNLARSFLNCVLLPDASILAVGGGTSPSTAHFMPEIYSPGSTGWTLLQPASSIRDYHSTALALPSGLVFTAGGENRRTGQSPAQPGFDYEIFSPPYNTSTTLPVQLPPTVSSINAASDTNGKYFILGRGATYTATISPMSIGSSIQSVVLMAPGSVTHHSDMSQRYHQLTFKHKSPTLVDFTTPTAGDALPAGIYMLQMVTNAGVPTKAVWVRL